MTEWLDVMWASPWGAAALGYLVGYFVASVQNMGQRKRLG